MSDSSGTRGTQAHNPGPDWSHLRETVLMMELAVAQVEAAMTDSNASVDALTGTFTTMANTIKLINERIGGLVDTEATAPVKMDSDGCGMGRENSVIMTSAPTT